jgi:hypothetical protein
MAWSSWKAGMGRESPGGGPGLITEEGAKKEPPGKDGLASEMSPVSRRAHLRHHHMVPLSYYATDGIVKA